MKTSVITIFMILGIFTNGFSQDKSDEIKGLWIIKKFRSVGEFGMTYQLAKGYVGDTITIDNSIKQSLEENKFTKAAGLTEKQCDYNPLKIFKIEEVEKYFADELDINPAILDIDNSKDIFMIETDCKNNMYKKFIYNKTDDKLMTIKNGMLFISSRLK